MTASLDSNEQQHGTERESKPKRNSAKHLRKDLRMMILLESFTPQQDHSYLTENVRSLTTRTTGSRWMKPDQDLAAKHERGRSHEGDWEYALRPECIGQIRKSRNEWDCRTFERGPGMNACSMCENSDLRTDRR